MSPPRLRIAQIAPIAGPVAADSAGSIEQLVWLLTQELVRRGHAVTLFATGDSRTSAALHAVYPRGYRHDDSLWEAEFHETMHAAAAFERARDFDVIHSHAYHYALPFSRLVQTPVVHTLHVMPDQDILRLYGRYPEAHVAAISDYQRRALGGGPAMDVVHHGVDTAAFPFNPARGGYLAFLGRMMARKGPVEAIDLARRIGMRLILAGPDEEDYFQAAVAPLVDGRWVEYAGPVAARERTALLSGAAALLYPLAAPEPFGLVMVEAMACGTPVAALGRGAVPEVVQQGVTGHHAPDVAALAARLPETLALDRRAVRDAAVARFDFRRMVDDYLAVYRRLVAGRRRRWAA